MTYSAPKSKHMPEVDSLRSAFEYCPETGRIAWKERNRNLSGIEAGSIDKSIGGYRRINFNGALMLAHRVAIAIVSGGWPEGEVDHINGDTADNRLCNLRVVDRQENMKNKSVYKTNKSGHIGVHWHKQHRKLAAAIQSEGKRKMLGVFSRIEDAISARKIAESSLVFHENHGRASR